MNDSNKRVVITSAGVVSPIGIGIDEFYQNMEADKSGLKSIQSFDVSEFDCKVAYEIQDFDPALYLGKKGLRNFDRITKFVLTAAHLALENRDDIDQMGVVLGTAHGGLHSIYEFERTAMRDGFVAVNPMHFPNTVLNAPASQINIRFGMKKLSETICTGLNSGIDAVGHAYRLIKNGELEVVLCGGADELNIEIFSWMNLTESFSGLGEGACLFVVESLENAKKNNRKILGEIADYGSVNAINKTLRNSNISINTSWIVAQEGGVEDIKLEIISRDKLEKAESIKTNIGACFAASGALQIASAIKNIESDNINAVLVSSVGNSIFNTGLILRKFE